MATAVLRRYTPPTCTLEIAAAGSALSRWTDRTVLKNLKFHLSFDDPKLSPEQQVTVSGDRTQLEVLCDVVSSYVQNLLASSPDQVLWEAPLQLGAEFRPPSHFPIESNREQMGMGLQPRGLLSHKLQLGSLATETSGSEVNLTTLQLFDLANALEDYHAEAVSLPTSSRPAWLNLPKGWASIAAVSVLALGATGILAKFVMDVSAPTSQLASTSQERKANSELNSELFPTLSPPPVEASPSITLQPLPPPPPPGGTTSNSPGLPPVGVTQAPADSTQLPAPATAPLPNATTSNQQVTVIPNPDTIAAAPSESSVGANSEATPPRLTGVEDEAPQAASRALAPSGSVAKNNSTAFDTIPQVAEIRQYFQQSWQPPDGLAETLEYRLLLNADGSLQRIVPLGQASENYIDRTNMPLMGEPFVSATSDGSTPQIRLVLKPTGQVQTFLEYAN